MLDSFRCLLVEQHAESILGAVTSLATERLPAGEVTVRVEYSSLNYKDALAYQGHRGIIKSLPHIPGIDAAGTVVDSQVERFAVGQHVVVTGYDLGQGTWGGWAELIRVPAAWIVPLPSSLSSREAMILGTAGFTAAQAVMALQRNEITPNQGEILVTGATGGVGSIAVCLLSQLGFQVVAVTGKLEQHDLLRELGATRVLGREELSMDSERPLLSARWAGAVDTVGGLPLGGLLRSLSYGGCVAACGLVAGADLPMTVYPFLLRGIALCGVASADCPYEKRREIWRRLAGEWKVERLERLASEVALERLPARVNDILAGKLVGRTVVKLP